MPHRALTDNAALTGADMEFITGFTKCQSKPESYRQGIRLALRWGMTKLHATGVSVLTVKQNQKQTHNLPQTNRHWIILSNISVIY